MKIQAVRFIEKGFYSLPMVFGGEDGPQHNKLPSRSVIYVWQ